MKAYLKALAPLVTAAAALAVQWITTGHFNVTAELVTVAYGAGTALLVLVTRNLPFSRVESIRKAVAAFGAAFLAVMLQWVNTRHFNASQELVTSVLGVVTAFAVYFVPNAGALVNAIGSLGTPHLAPPGATARSV